MPFSEFFECERDSSRAVYLYMYLRKTGGGTAVDGMESGLPGSLKGDSEIAGNYLEIPMKVEIPGNMDTRKS